MSDSKPTEDREKAAMRDALRKCYELSVPLLLKRDPTLEKMLAEIHQITEKYK